MPPRTRQTPEQVAADLADQGRLVDSDYTVRHRLPKDERNRARARAASMRARASALRAQARIDAELRRRQEDA